MKKIEVVAAVILNDNQILCVQRPEHKLDYISKKFEFPGGKIEIGESQKEALARELFEELDMNAIVDEHILTVEHKYPDFELTMHAFWVHANSRELSLNEHISLQWLDKDKLNEVDWAAADIPIVDKLMAMEWMTL
ncbi:MAG: (deoxy)nucleoside triphosphate pyrophosphohydrolase [Bacteroidetes bacterium]|nr:(deoxy)nucleoside triphosphate pyrophosphohydrolase [Bacteroidota bacterium]